MSLSKFKRHHGFTANRVFTDRDEPRRIFWNAYEKLLYNEDIFQVVAFYGMGGIGKTRLQSFLSEEVDKRIRDGETKKIKQVLISLDAFEFDSPTDILIAIRKQLKIPTFLFDYALISYWSSVGYTAIDIKRRFISEDSVIWDVLDEVANLGGVAVPLRLVRAVTQKVVDKYIKAFGRYKEDLAEIDQSQPIDLFRKLPYYLGLALSNAYEQDGIKHIIYFDA